MGARADIAGDPNNPDISIAWKVTPAPQVKDDIQ
jgi:hypothetical protein